MRTIQKIAFYFGIVNLVIGLAGFTGPLVTKNDEKIINLKPGLLFNIFAINWLHALVHLLAGSPGCWSKRAKTLRAPTCGSARSCLGR